MLEIRSEMSKIIKNVKMIKLGEISRIGIPEVGSRKIIKNFSFPGKLKIREKRKPYVAVKFLTTAILIKFRPPNSSNAWRQLTAWVHQNTMDSYPHKQYNQTETTRQLNTGALNP